MARQYMRINAFSGICVLETFFLNDFFLFCKLYKLFPRICLYGKIISSYIL